MREINWESEGEASESGKKMGYSDFRKFETNDMEYHIHAHGNNKWHLTRIKVSKVPAGVSTQQLDDRWDMSMAEIESQIARWEGWLNCTKVTELWEKDIDFSWEKINFDRLADYNGISKHNGTVQKIKLHEEDGDHFVLQHSGVVDKKTGTYTLITDDPIVKVRRFYFDEDFNEYQARIFIRDWESKNE